MLCSLPSKTAFGFDPSTHDPPRGQEDAANANATTSEPEVLTDSPSSWQFLPHQIFTESEIHQPTDSPTNHLTNPILEKLGWLVEKFFLRNPPSLTKIPISWKVSHHFEETHGEKSPAFLVTGSLPGLPLQAWLFDVVAVKKMFQVTKVNSVNCWNHHRKRESWKSMLGESSFIIYPVNMFDVEGRPNSKFKQPQFPAHTAAKWWYRDLYPLFWAPSLCETYSKTRSKNRENPFRKPIFLKTLFK